MITLVDHLVRARVGVWARVVISLYLLIWGDHPRSGVRVRVRVRVGVRARVRARARVRVRVSLLDGEDERGAGRRGVATQAIGGAYGDAVRYRGGPGVRQKRG